jgi:hypothetical protein
MRHLSDPRKITPPQLNAGLNECVSVEPVRGWWTNDNHWGNRISKDMPPTPGVILDVTDSGPIPGPPRSVGVTLFRSPRIINDVNSSNDAINAEIYCQLIYSAGGVSNTVLIDWSNGGTFALQANMLRVSAVSYAPLFPAEFVPYNNQSQFVGVPSKLNLACTIGIDGVSPPRAPTFTTRMRRLLATTPTLSVVATVPPFARRVWPLVFPNVVVGPPFPPLVYSDYSINMSGDFRTWCRYELSPEIVTQGLPVAGTIGQVAINLTTVAPTHDATVAFVFELGL